MNVTSALLGPLEQFGTHGLLSIQQFIASCSVAVLDNSGSALLLVGSALPTIAETLLPYTYVALLICGFLSQYNFPLK